MSERQKEHFQPRPQICHWLQPPSSSRAKDQGNPPNPQGTKQTKAIFKAMLKYHVIMGYANGPTSSAPVMSLVLWFEVQDSQNNSVWIWHWNGGQINEERRRNSRIQTLYIVFIWISPTINRRSLSSVCNPVKERTLPLYNCVPATLHLCFGATKNSISNNQ